MLNGKKVLAVIPARGGSKGVPRKNIREVAGKPLIAWTIQAARESRYIDRLVLSSEDAEIIEVAKGWGCEVPFVRPPELSRDDTPGIEPVLHAVQSLPGFDYVVLLQPTSPLRNARDIDSCLELCASKKASTCVSVSEPDHSPYWMFTLDPQGCMHRLMDTQTEALRRQDLPTVYALNGAVYVADTTAIVKTRSFVTEDTACYVMSQASSVDVDTELDLVVADALLRVKR